MKFFSRGANHALFLTQSEAVLRITWPDGGSKTSGAVLKMRPLRANERAAIEGESVLPGTSNYLFGRDAGNWKTAVPHFAKVRYRDLYPGVDLVYYGNDKQLEYDFIVAPGADPSLPRFVIEGAERVRIDEAGDLVLETRAGEIRHRKPLIYQEDGGLKTMVAGGYRLHGNEVSFRVGSYDHSRTLIIDPALSYATFLGGERDDHVAGIAVDAAGNAYVTGSTQSAGFPTTVGSYDVMCGTDGNCNAGGADNRDVFVTKINPAGTALVYSTFIVPRQ